uniref:EOG090X0EEC n=1 Tax=Daphnia lumholtzi TaxID=42856 RepID=A0A4Y7M8Z0_9CRUS|nr:EOG090X0EEC [Daphnia lumholtzi]SVE78518.1 EOG090X0EEC [Daphnia lumholtzi]
MTGSTSSNSSNNDGYADKIVQVANVAPQANKEQMQTLFGIIGKIEDLRLYPTLRDLSAPVQLRICFVKYADPNDVPVALHLSNTVFIDRAVSVTLYHGNELPDEAKGVEILNSSSGFGSSEPKLPATLTNQIEGNPPHQVIRTLDPRLSIHNLPNYPLLPASTDSRRLEEIRRTVVAINLDPSRSAKQVIDFFSSAGEVKYFRFCTKQGDDIQYAMIEFVEQESVVPALKLNNKQFGDNIIKVHHSTQSIIKPVQQTKSNEAAQKEIEEAVNRVKEAQQLIPVPLSQEDIPEKEKEKEKVIMEVEKEKPKIVEKEKEKIKEKEKEKEKEKSSKRSRTRSKSRSRSRHRSSSRSRRRRSRSKSRERRKRSRSRSRRRTRSRSKSKERRKRSRSREKKRSRSRDRRRRSRSRSRSRKEKSPRPTRDRRERSPKERTKDRDRDKSHKDKDKDKDRDKEKTRDKDKSRDKDKRDREKKEKKRDKKEKEREREKEKERKPKSPASKEDSSTDEKEISERNSARRSTPPSPPPSKSKSRRRSKSGSRGRSR